MKLIILAVICSFLCINTHSQTNYISIYKNQADFREKVNPLIVNCKKGNNSFRVSNMFFSPYLYIKTDSYKTKIPLDSVYAYTDNKGNNYRIWDKSAFLLCESGILQIYSQPQWITIKIQTSRSYRYENKKVLSYFFAISDTSKILPLTLNNIFREMYCDKKSYKELISQFPDDKSLTKKDEDEFILNQFINKQK